jgi:hypothetical protein
MGPVLCLLLRLLLSLLLGLLLLGMLVSMLLGLLLLSVLLRLLLLGMRLSLSGARRREPHCAPYLSGGYIPSKRHRHPQREVEPPCWKGPVTLCR